MHRRLNLVWRERRCRSAALVDLRSPLPAPRARKYSQKRRADLFPRPLNGRPSLFPLALARAAVYVEIARRERFLRANWSSLSRAATRARKRRPFT